MQRETTLRKDLLVANRSAKLCCWRERRQTDTGDAFHSFGRCVSLFRWGGDALQETVTRILVLSEPGPARHPPPSPRRHPVGPPGSSHVDEHILVFDRASRAATKMSVSPLSTIGLSISSHCPGSMAPAGSTRSAAAPTGSKHATDRAPTSRAGRR